MKIKGGVTCNYEVEFTEPDKILKYLQGDFSDVFWEVCSLDEFAENVATQLVRGYEFYEGIGDFYPYPQGWVTKPNEHIGQIVVEVHYDS